MPEFWKVPRIWVGCTVVCIAGGPSLTPAQVDRCRGTRMIAVNDACRLAPWADFLYGCDLKWWRWHKGVAAFDGVRVTLDKRVVAEYPGIKLLENTGIEGLEDAPTGLRTGRNSGYQAVGLAVQLGAARILLLGYDMKPMDGRAHWFGDHPRPTLPADYVAWLKAWGTITAPLAVAGVEVINCTPDSALDVFERRDLADCL